MEAFEDVGEFDEGGQVRREGLCALEDRSSPRRLDPARRLVRVQERDVPEVLEIPQIAEIVEVREETKPER